MISKAKVKYVKSLQLKKYRIEEQCFLVEGEKSVEELLRSDFELVCLAARADLLHRWEQRLGGAEAFEASEAELTGMSSLQTNDAAVAVAKMKPNPEWKVNSKEFALVLDDIRDPGNLGTIIRTADWYGINKIIASEETADFYNPKTIIATMGSFCRVQVLYTHLATYLPSISLPVMGTFLDGQSVHDYFFPTAGLVVIGNESKGISAEVEQQVSARLTIPRFGKAESLNAGIATAIVLDNLRRQIPA